ncbi:MAG: hypothetical protein JEZ11_24835 [Desulfobacterales bacterium]|nr:hypothetical protein [Desulfobacterales bacterium]
MNWTISQNEAAGCDPSRIGGKAWALARAAGAGLPVPAFLCVTTEAYRYFVDETGLRTLIDLEVHRKDFEQMRWEEIWDCATRIRNLFLTRDMPQGLKPHLKDHIEGVFGHRPVAVRSSAPEEDAAGSSFAGLHDSYLNLHGTTAVLDHIRRVWASLWSDAALLYRRELDLDVTRSAMAVVVQETVIGDRSGVVFTQNPNAPGQMVIEAVHGLNQGMVDGSVTPDRWLVERAGNRITEHIAAERSWWVVPRQNAVGLADLPEERKNRPPLGPADLQQVLSLATQAEGFFEFPQDVEWTFAGNRIVLLQSRSITTLADTGGSDRRGWYLSLHRSLDNLLALRKEIEDRLLPEMARVTEELARTDITALPHDGLAEEIEHRWKINAHWSKVYWDKFIPFAHGFRLFGQYYNDLIRPEDPHEFIDLLTSADMLSLERNGLLAEMAAMLRDDPRQMAAIRQDGIVAAQGELARRIETFRGRFGDLTCTLADGQACQQERSVLATLLLEMATHPPTERIAPKPAITVRTFLDGVPPRQRSDAETLLDLARASYRLRDDDNIFLGRIEDRYQVAIEEGRRRMAATGPDTTRLKEVLDRLAPTVGKKPEEKSPPAGPVLKARQLVGQPAGPGLAKATARVVETADHLADFRSGEVLVCDSVDPNMTFVVPLAAAIVERRGGMLIHGAIIAREYGLPCVTGVSHATKLIHTGDRLTVDGYLGIVTIGETPGGMA